MNYTSPRRKLRVAMTFVGLATFVAAASTFVLLVATGADASTPPHMLATTDVRWAPYNSGLSQGSASQGSSVSLVCSETGDAVTGPYGTETIWDALLGGGFVPDALVYTGSNTAVVPSCGAMVRTTAVDQTPPYPVNLSIGSPSESAPTAAQFVNGQTVMITCYVTGENVPGPYGWENIWDQVFSSRVIYVPDALVYTGSNSAVVPHC